MKRYHLKNIFFLILALTVSSCGKVFLNATSGTKSSTSSFEFDDASAFNDMKNRCGGSSTDIANTETPFISLTLKSLPFITTGKENGIDYKVELEADVKVESRGPLNHTHTDIRITNLTANSGNVQATEASIAKYIRPSAEQRIEKWRGKSSKTSLSLANLLKLYRGESPYSSYRGLFCAVSFSLGGQDDKGGQKGEITFDRPVPTGINPKASSESYRAEIGKSRAFNATATVTVSKEGWIPEGTSVPVTATIAEISPDISKLQGMPSDLKFPTINADRAYEITFSTSSAITFNQIGLTKRSVYYINTSARSFAAVVNDSDELVDGQKQVPVIMIPEVQ